MATVMEFNIRTAPVTERYPLKELIKLVKISGFTLPQQVFESLSRAIHNESIMAKNNLCLYALLNITKHSVAFHYFQYVAEQDEEKQHKLLDRLFVEINREQDAKKIEKAINAAVHKRKCLPAIKIILGGIKFNGPRNFSDDIKEGWQYLIEAAEAGEPAAIAIVNQHTKKEETTRSRSVSSSSNIVEVSAASPKAVAQPSAPTAAASSPPLTQPNIPAAPTTTDSPLPPLTQLTATSRELATPTLEALAQPSVPTVPTTATSFPAPLAQLTFSAPFAIPEAQPIYGLPLVPHPQFFDLRYSALWPHMQVPYTSHPQPLLFTAAARLQPFVWPTATPAFGHIFPTTHGLSAASAVGPVVAPAEPVVATTTIAAVSTSKRKRNNVEEGQTTSAAPTMRTSYKARRVGTNSGRR